MRKSILLALAVVGIGIALTACDCKHEYRETIIAKSSCTNGGSKLLECVKCKDHYLKDIPAAGHAFGEATVTKAASCNEEGEMAAVCTACGEKNIVQTLPVLPHSYQLESEIPATCTEQGANILICSVCHDVSREYTAALGHNYQQTDVIKEASCTSDGKTKIVCSHCNDSYTKAIRATGHEWVEASCTRAKHCKNCSLKEGEAFEHDYSPGVDGTCNRCGIKKMTLIHDEQASKSTLEYRIESTGVTVSRVSVIWVSYNTYDGYLQINVKFKRTYDGYAESTPSEVGFSFTLYDSEGNIVRQEAPAYHNVRVGQEYYVSYVYHLEPDTYTIVLDDKIA